MGNSGYTEERARPAREAERRVYDELKRRGYDPKILKVDGHRPDIQLGSGDYVEVKTKLGRRLAIELDDFTEWHRIRAMEGKRVYIVSLDDSRDDYAHWKVDTPESLVARMIQGPQRPTGNGSNDDWQLIGVGGTDFVDFFRTASEIRDDVEQFNRDAWNSKGRKRGIHT